MLFLFVGIKHSFLLVNAFFQKQQKMNQKIFSMLRHIDD